MDDTKLDASGMQTLSKGDASHADTRNVQVPSVAGGDGAATPDADVPPNKEVSSRPPSSKPTPPEPPIRQEPHLDGTAGKGVQPPAAEKPEGLGQEDGPKKDSKPAANQHIQPPRPMSEETHEETHQDEAGKEIPLKEYEVLPLLAGQGLWRVASEYLRLGQCPSEKSLASILSVVSLQPLLCTGDSRAIDFAATELQSLAVRPPFNDIYLDLLYWTGFVIPALTAPQTGAAALIRGVNLGCQHQSLLPIDPFKALNDAVIDLTGKVKNLTPDMLKGGKLEETRTNLHSRVSTFIANAPRQAILYQPATIVWRDICKNGRLASAARIILGKGNARDVDEIYETIKIFSETRKLRLYVNEVDRRINRRANGIEARAIDQIQGHAEEMLDCAREWIKLQEIQTNEDYIAKQITSFHLCLQRARTGIDSSLREMGKMNLSAYGDLARLSCEFTWKHLKVLTGLEEMPPSDVAEIGGWQAELYRIPQLDIDEQYRICGEAEGKARTIVEAYARKPSSIEKSLRERLKRGDIFGARELMRFMPQDDGRLPDLETEICDEETAWSNRINEKLKAIKSLFDTNRSMGLMDETESTEIDENIVRLLDISKAKTIRFNELDARCEELSRKMCGLRDKRAEEVRQELDKLRGRTSDQDIRRIRAILDSGDVLTAREYIGRLDEGGSLSDIELSRRDVWREFFPDTARELAKMLDDMGGIDAVRRALHSDMDFGSLQLSIVPGAQRSEAMAMIDAWQNLKGARLCGNEKLKLLLEKLGFQILGIQLDEPQNARQNAQVRCKAITDRQLCPVPRFGSDCNGEYTFINVWERPAEDAIIQHVGDTSAMQRPVIVIYYGRMTDTRRRDLARLCREHSRTFLLLDETLLVYLCGERGLRLPAFFRCALPFSYADPYITAASLVPTEMFYGRERELGELQDTNRGGCFVYGGRQLGKTALLREAQRRFHSPKDDRFSLWLDLINLGLGTEREPSGIWQVLLEEFARLMPESFEIDHKRSSDPAARFIEQARKFLKSNTKRRILLLLDEADRFLERDSVEDFSVSRKLKGLMDSTDRHMKIVFAGLHNVQRTTQQSNHPLAHLGEPINVGSFANKGDWIAGLRLASEPLEALGYRFANRDLVMRILALCNFYPGLIQKFGSSLLRHLNDRIGSGLPGDIGERDVEEVYNNKDLREFIVGRFKLTLQLDPRYYVVAYVLAHLFHEKKGNSFDAIELQSSASDFWMEGFRGMSLEEFATLLDEMCGLGVLRHSEKTKHYSLRNPNLLLLLGNKEEIERVLLTGPRTVKEYQPKTFHPRLHMRHIDRYPLTLAQEGEILKAGRGCMFLVASDALKMEILKEAMRNRLSAVAQFVDPGNVSDPARLNNVVKKFLDKDNTSALFWMPLPEGWKLEQIGMLEAFLGSRPRSRANIRIVIAADPAQWWGLLSEIRKNHAAPKHPYPVVRTLKWKPEFIEPWLTECGFLFSDGREEPEKSQAKEGIAGGGAANIEKVTALTGGWPVLLYRLVQEFDRSNDQAKAMETLQEWLQKRENSDAVLRQYGFAKEPAAGLKAKLLDMHKLSNGQAVGKPDFEVLAETLGIEAAAVRNIVEWATDVGLLDELSPDTWEWDPVFDRIIRGLHQ